MTEFSFVHAADLHLDAPFRGLGMLSEDTNLAPRKALRQAGFLALERLTSFCLASGADFLLLAGDVYNSADSSLRARLALRDAFVRLGESGIGVFMVHGNHDPFQAEQSAVPWPDNVHVFGPEVESRPAFGKNGGQVARIYGASHAGPAETRNLAANFKPETSLEPELFQIGLLHCAVAEIGGGHALYAPCLFADLAGAGLDYWALGHVHACRLFDRRGRVLPQPFCQPGTIAPAVADKPLAAYSGSIQGLHVNESGPHGCLHIRVDSRGRTTPVGITLAPVQWETLDIEPGLEITGLPALEAMLLERLEALAALACPATLLPGQGFAPESMAVRIRLCGQSPLYADFAKPGAIEELHRRLGLELSDGRVWIWDIESRLAPLLDIEAAKLRPDLAGEVLRLAASLEGDALLRSASAALDPLFTSPRLRKILDPPEPGELKTLVDRAALLCFELLAPQEIPDEGEED